ncbi:MAG: GMC oxidoreductase [Pseudonocardiaceae bacterium]
MVIEEVSIPGALTDYLPLAMLAVARASGIDTLQDRIKELARELNSLALGPYRGAVRHTQTYLVMSHDDGNGCAVLEEDRLRIHWPHVGGQPVFHRISKALQDATEALGGTYLTSPIWNKLLGERLVTVHPLGGCVMADDAERGVVNHKGQVFAGSQGSPVYEGLYVSDGAVIPRTWGSTRYSPSPLWSSAAARCSPKTEAGPSITRCPRCRACLRDHKPWVFSSPRP